MDPATQRGRASRARIVEAAARLMHVNGVAATSVDEVLAEAGAGKSQFYHYFPSKDDLVAAVLEHQARSGESEQAKLFARHSGWAGIRAWLDSVLEGQRRAAYAGGCPVGSLAAELVDRNPEFRPLLESAFQRKADMLTTRLHELQREGSLSSDADPESLAVFVLATLQGGLLLGSTFKGDEPLVRATEEAWAHLQTLRRVTSPGGPPPGPSNPRRARRT